MLNLLVLSTPLAQQHFEYLTFMDQKLGPPILSPQIRYFSDKDQYLGASGGLVRLRSAPPVPEVPIIFQMGCK
jgi:hypothetical protein